MPPQEALPSTLESVAIVSGFWMSWTTATRTQLRNSKTIQIVKTLQEQFIRYSAFYFQINDLSSIKVANYTGMRVSKDSMYILFDTFRYSVYKTISVETLHSLAF